MKRRMVVGLLLFCLFLPQGVGASDVGFADWEIETPGKNKISHMDPFKEQFSTVLRMPEIVPGVLKEELVLVRNLRWWQFFPGYVAGGTDKDFFLFHEATQAVTFFQSEGELKGQIKRLNVGKPVSKKMTPVDGWYSLWGDAISR